MRIVPDGEVSKLAEVIDVYYAPSEIAKPDNRGFANLRKIGTLMDVLEGADLQQTVLDRTRGQG